jgi:hypothetical protein
LNEKFFEKINPNPLSGANNGEVPDKGFRVNNIIFNTFSPVQEKAYLEIKENFNNSPIIPFHKGDENKMSTEGFNPLNLLY